LKRNKLLGLLSIGFISISRLLMAEKELFVPANDVSFTLSIPHKRYRTGETVILRYRITNISNAPLYVPRAWEEKCPAQPHVLLVGFENEAGHHLLTGYGGDCSPDNTPKTVTARMKKEAVLLKPGEHLDGTDPINTATFDFLKPGTYRFEALLEGWRQDEFSAKEQAELATMMWPFVRGEVPASIKVVLKP
jgi:hypothetical protein